MFAVGYFPVPGGVSTGGGGGGGGGSGDTTGPDLQTWIDFRDKLNVTPGRLKEVATKAFVSTELGYYTPLYIDSVNPDWPSWELTNERFMQLDGHVRSTTDSTAIQAQLNAHTQQIADTVPDAVLAFLPIANDRYFALKPWPVDSPFYDPIKPNYDQLKAYVDSINAHANTNAITLTNLDQFVKNPTVTNGTQNQLNQLSADTDTLRDQLNTLPTPITVYLREQSPGYLIDNDFTRATTVPLLQLRPWALYMAKPSALYPYLDSAMFHFHMPFSDQRVFAFTVVNASDTYPLRLMCIEDHVSFKRGSYQGMAYSNAYIQPLSVMHFIRIGSTNSGDPNKQLILELDFEADIASTLKPVFTGVP